MVLYGFVLSLFCHSFFQRIDENWTFLTVEAARGKKFLEQGALGIASEETPEMRCVLLHPCKLVNPVEISLVGLSCTIDM